MLSEIMRLAPRFRNSEEEKVQNTPEIVFKVKLNRVGSNYMCSCTLLAGYKRAYYKTKAIQERSLRLAPEKNIITILNWFQVIPTRPTAKLIVDKHCQIIVF
jgi:hypothetical protein